MNAQRSKRRRGEACLRRAARTPYSAAMNRPDPDAAKQDLRRLGQGGDLFSSSIHGSSGQPPEEEDWAERVGRRIGRGLAVVAAAGLIAYYFLFPG